MKKIDRKKLGIGAGISMGVIIGMLVMANVGNVIVDDVHLESIEKELVWHTVDVWSPLGENDPGAGTGGFMSCFLLDYGEVPETVLQNNATDWEASGDVHAYADGDDWSEDTPSEDPFYFVVRACFTQDQCMSGGNWNGSRARVTLTVSGDETISAYCIWGNDTAETYGGGIESDNNSDFDKLYINFYWDDNSDGYQISDDGSITVSEIKIEAKY